MATKTKDVIVKSFLSLIKNEDFDKITVTDLVDECQISRQTFYYHFDDISRMLEWAFQKETKNICNKARACSNCFDAASGYIEFLQKYEILLKKSMNSTKFIFIYNLLYQSFIEFTDYLVSRKKHTKEALGKNLDFIIEWTASSFAGLIIITIQNENPDYKGLLQKIQTSMTGISKVK